MTHLFERSDLFYSSSHSCSSLNVHNGGLLEIMDMGMDCGRAAATTKRLPTFYNYLPATPNWIREGFRITWSSDLFLRKTCLCVPTTATFWKFSELTIKKVMTMMMLLTMKMLGTYIWPARIGFKSDLIQDPSSLMTLAQPMVLIHCFVGCVILKMDPASETRNGCCAFVVAREQFFSTLILLEQFGCFRQPSNYTSTCFAVSKNWRVTKE